MATTSSLKYNFFEDNFSKKLCTYEDDTDMTGFNLLLIEDNNRFIKLLSKLNKQYAEAMDFDMPFSSIQRTFSKACSSILFLRPDKISVELSYNNSSITFTFKKDEYTFFFEKFLDDNKKDEVIYSCYKNSIKQPSFAGNFSASINSIVKELYPNNPYYFYNILQNSCLMNELSD